MSKFTRYSLNTAMSVMRLHLQETHDVSLSCAKLKTRLSQSKMPEGRHQVNLFASVKTSSTKTDRNNFNKDLMAWLAMDLLPFSTVESEGFRYFFRQQFPNTTLPSESNLRTTVLPQVYAELKDTRRSQ